MTRYFQATAGRQLVVLKMHSRAVSGQRQMYSIPDDSSQAFRGSEWQNETWMCLCNTVAFVLDIFAGMRLDTPCTVRVEYSIQSPYLPRFALHLCLPPQSTPRYSDAARYIRPIPCRVIRAVKHLLHKLHPDAGLVPLPHSLTLHLLPVCLFSMSGLLPLLRLMTGLDRRVKLLPFLCPGQRCFAGSMTPDRHCPGKYRRLPGRWRWRRNIRSGPVLPGCRSRGKSLKHIPTRRQVRGPLGRADLHRISCGSRALPGGGKPLQSGGNERGGSHGTVLRAHCGS